MIMLPIAQANLVALFSLEIWSDGGVLRYRVFDREETRTVMISKLSQAARLFGSNYVVHLLCNTNVSAPELVQTIADIQESGVHSVILMSQGVKHGTSGIYQINVNCSKWPHEEMLGLLHSGFNATNEPSEYISRHVRYFLEQLLSMTNGSQQSVAPLPRAPPTGHSEGER